MLVSLVIAAAAVIAGAWLRWTTRPAVVSLRPPRSLEQLLAMPAAMSPRTPHDLEQLLGRSIPPQASGPAAWKQ
jgi:hypothetical protein